MEYRYRFYDKLYERADRRRMLVLAHNLRASVGRYLLFQRVDEKHSHEALIPFLRAGDVDGAKAWLTEHLGRRSVRLREFVIGQDSPNESRRVRRGLPARI
ncbi:hypothetical protein A4X20_22520 [Mycolicibacterium iranicum]|uniref:GntR C-terminal domain-containing protein n=1 Tax=Mycolicibacterium iranicum TaxID=912594 RepID=A0A178LU36_MYCIR|nr:hypothetical protein A4X20_22520 [Mycolicibacterium iranicum]